MTDAHSSYSKDAADLAANPGKGTIEPPIDRLATWPNFAAEMPLEPLAQAARHVGFFNAVHDPDGTLRRSPPVTRLDAREAVHGDSVVPNVATGAPVRSAGSETPATSSLRTARSGGSGSVGRSP